MKHEDITQDYTNFVKERIKPADQIIQHLDLTKMDLMHMTFGVCGESGELLDAIKKHIIYNKPLDINHVIEELGDIEFYLEGLRQVLGISRIHILTHNVAKLGKRYPTTYSDKAAIERNDKIIDDAKFQGRN